MRRHWGLFTYFFVLSIAFVISPLSQSATPSKPTAESEKALERTSAGKVDLNTATKAELETLPGVGPATANEIVAARPFKRVEDLQNVKGIGEARYQELKSEVTVGRHTTAARSVRSEDATRAETPAKRVETSTTTPRNATPHVSAKVNINTADAQTLETLPGVGPSTAHAIIAARPFRSVDDLKAVKGIGETRLDQIRPLVTVRDESARSANTVRSSAGSAPATATGSSRDASRIPPNAAPAPLGKGAEQKATSNTAETKININTASREELESLLGIGPVKAQAIIDNRPYKEIDDVMRIKGIKEGTFDDIRERIRVR